MLRFLASAVGDRLRKTRDGSADPEELLAEQQRREELLKQRQVEEQEHYDAFLSDTVLGRRLSELMLEIEAECSRSSYAYPVTPEATIERVLQKSMELTVDVRAQASSTHSGSNVGTRGGGVERQSGAVGNESGDLGYGSGSSVTSEPLPLRFIVLLMQRLGGACGSLPDSELLKYLADALPGLCAVYISNQMNGNLLRELGLGQHLCSVLAFLSKRLGDRTYVLRQQHEQERRRSASFASSGVLSSNDRLLSPSLAPLVEVIPANDGGEAGVALGSSMGASPSQAQRTPGLVNTADALAMAITSTERHELLAVLRSSLELLALLHNTQTTSPTAVPSSSTSNNNSKATASSFSRNRSNHVELTLTNESGVSTSSGSPPLPVSGSFTATSTVRRTSAEMFWKCTAPSKSFEWGHIYHPSQRTPLNGNTSTDNTSTMFCSSRNQRSVSPSSSGSPESASPGSSHHSRAHSSRINTTTSPEARYSVSPGRVATGTLLNASVAQRDLHMKEHEATIDRLCVQEGVRLFFLLCKGGLGESNVEKDDEMEKLVAETVEELGFMLLALFNVEDASSYGANIDVVVAGVGLLIARLQLLGPDEAHNTTSTNTYDTAANSLQSSAASTSTKFVPDAETACSQASPPSPSQPSPSSSIDLRQVCLIKQLSAGLLLIAGFLKTFAVATTAAMDSVDLVTTLVTVLQCVGRCFDNTSLTEEGRVAVIEYSKIIASLTDLDLPQNHERNQPLSLSRPRFEQLSSHPVADEFLLAYLALLDISRLIRAHPDVKGEQRVMQYINELEQTVIISLTTLQTPLPLTSCLFDLVLRYTVVTLPLSDPMVADSGRLRSFKRLVNAGLYGALFHNRFCVAFRRDARLHYATLYILNYMITRPSLSLDSRSSLDEEVGAIFDTIVQEEYSDPAHRDREIAPMCTILLSGLQGVNATAVLSAVLRCNGIPTFATAINKLAARRCLRDRSRSATIVSEKNSESSVLISAEDAETARELALRWIVYVLEQLFAQKDVQLFVLNSEPRIVLSLLAIVEVRANVEEMLVSLLTHPCAEADYNERMLNMAKVWWEAVCKYEQYKEEPTASELNSDSMLAVSQDEAPESLDHTLRKGTDSMFSSQVRRRKSTVVSDVAEDQAEHMLLSLLYCLRTAIMRLQVSHRQNVWSSARLLQNIMCDPNTITDCLSRLLNRASLPWKAIPPQQGVVAIVMTIVAMIQGNPTLRQRLVTEVGCERIVDTVSDAWPRNGSRVPFVSAILALAFEDDAENASIKLYEDTQDVISKMNSNSQQELDSAADGFGGASGGLANSSAVVDALDLMSPLSKRVTKTVLHQRDKGIAACHFDMQNPGFLDALMKLFFTSELTNAKCEALRVILTRITISCKESRVTLWQVASSDMFEALTDVISILRDPSLLEEVQSLMVLIATHHISVRHLKRFLTTFIYAKNEECRRRLLPVVIEVMNEASYAYLRCRTVPSCYIAFRSRSGPVGIKVALGEDFPVDGYTLSMWLRAEKLQRDRRQCIFSLQSEERKTVLELFYYQDKLLIAFHDAQRRSVEVDLGCTMVSQSWSHLVISHRQAAALRFNGLVGLQLYLNGVEVVSSNRVDYPVISQGYLYIATKGEDIEQRSMANAFHGQVTAVYFFNRTLAAREVRDLSMTSSGAEAYLGGGSITTAQRGGAVVPNRFGTKGLTERATVCIDPRLSERGRLYNLAAVIRGRSKEVALVTYEGTLTCRCNSILDATCVLGALHTVIMPLTVMLVSPRLPLRSTPVTREDVSNNNSNGGGTLSADSDTPIRNILKLTESLVAVNIVRAEVVSSGLFCMTSHMLHCLGSTLTTDIPQRLASMCAALLSDPLIFDNAYTQLFLRSDVLRSMRPETQIVYFSAQRVICSVNDEMRKRVRHLGLATFIANELVYTFNSHSEHDFAMRKQMFLLLGTTLTDPVSASEADAVFTIVWFVTKHADEFRARARNISLSQRGDKRSASPQQSASVTRVSVGGADVVLAAAAVDAAVEVEQDGRRSTSPSVDSSSEKNVEDPFTNLTGTDRVALDILQHTRVLLVASGSGFCEQLGNKSFAGLLLPLLDHCNELIRNEALLLFALLLSRSRRTQEIVNPKLHSSIDLNHLDLDVSLLFLKDKLQRFPVNERLYITYRDAITGAFGKPADTPSTRLDLELKPTDTVVVASFIMPLLQLVKRSPERSLRQRAVRDLARLLTYDSNAWKRIVLLQGWYLQLSDIALVDDVADGHTDEETLQDCAHVFVQVLHLALLHETYGGSELEMVLSYLEQHRMGHFLIARILEGLVEEFQHRLPRRVNVPTGAGAGAYMAGHGGGMGANGGGGSVIVVGSPNTCPLSTVALANLTVLLYVIEDQMFYRKTIMLACSKPKEWERMRRGYDEAEELLLIDSEKDDPQALPKGPDGRWAHMKLAISTTELLTCHSYFVNTAGIVPQALAETSRVGSTHRKGGFQRILIRILRVMSHFTLESSDALDTIVYGSGRYTDLLEKESSSGFILTRRGAPNEVRDHAALSNCMILFHALHTLLVRRLESGASVKTALHDNIDEQLLDHMKHLIQVNYRLLEQTQAFRVDTGEVYVEYKHCKTRTLAWMADRTQLDVSQSFVEVASRPDYGAFIGRCTLVQGKLKHQVEKIVYRDVATTHIAIAGVMHVLITHLSVTRQNSLEAVDTFCQNVREECIIEDSERGASFQETATKMNYALLAATWAKFVERCKGTIWDVDPAGRLTIKYVKLLQVDQQVLIRRKLQRDPLGTCHQDVPVFTHRLMTKNGNSSDGGASSDSQVKVMPPRIRGGEDVLLRDKEGKDADEEEIATGRGNGDDSGSRAQEEQSGASSVTQESTGVVVSAAVAAAAAGRSGSSSTAAAVAPAASAEKGSNARTTTTTTAGDAKLLPNVPSPTSSVNAMAVTASVMAGGPIADDTDHEFAVACELAYMMHCWSAVLYLKGRVLSLIIDDTNHAYNQTVPVGATAFLLRPNSISMDIGSIVRLAPGRRFRMRRTALELWMSDGRSFFFNFPSVADMRNAATHIRECADKLKTAYAQLYVMHDNPKRELVRGRWTEQWRNREISNFDYLIILNLLAGRTVNDLTQYPVFPWIIADQTSETLNFEDPLTFRDLSLPIGVCGDPNRRREVSRRYDEMKMMGDVPSHYFTHYSSPAVTLYYMVRVEPFTTLQILLQGGHFDHADRMFHSFSACWSGVTKNMQDVRELIPEMFYLPEICENNNGVRFGTKQDGNQMEDLLLPPWAMGDAYRFTFLMREALESDYVSANLHHWIDLIFGYKQRGKDAIEAMNMFNWYSYEDLSSNRGKGTMSAAAVTMDAESGTESHELDVEQKLLIDSLDNIGQTPIQLFTKKHPERCSNDLLDPLSPECNLTVRSVSVPWFFTRIAFIAVVCLDRIVIVGGNGAAVALRIYPSPVRKRGTGTSNSAVVRPTSALPTTRRLEDAVRSAYRSSLVSFDVLEELDSRLQFLPTGVIPNLTNFADGPCVPESVAVLSYDSEVFVVYGGLFDNSCIIRSLPSSADDIRLIAHHGRVTCIATSADSRFLVTSAEDTTFIVWNCTMFKGKLNVELCFTIYGHEDNPTAIGVCPILDLVVTGSKDGVLMMHSLHSAQLEHSLRHPERHPIDRILIQSTCYTPNILYTSKADNVIHQISVNGRHLRTFSIPGQITSWCSTPQQYFLVSYIPTAPTTKQTSQHLAATSTSTNPGSGGNSPGSRSNSPVTSGTGAAHPNAVVLFVHSLLLVTQRSSCAADASETGVHITALACHPHNPQVMIGGTMEAKLQLLRVEQLSPTAASPVISSTPPMAIPSASSTSVTPRIRPSELSTPDFREAMFLQSENLV